VRGEAYWYPQSYVIYIYGKTLFTIALYKWVLLKGKQTPWEGSYVNKTGLKVYPVSMTIMMMKVTVDKFKNVRVPCSKTGHSIYSKKCTVIGYNDTQTW